jgi:lipopolysaccharide export system protein LptA
MSRLVRRNNVVAIAKCAILLLLLIPSAHSVFGQKKPSKKAPKQVNFYHSDYLLYDKDVVDAKRFIGNVRGEYQGTMFYCDSLYQYNNGDFDAFSNIRVTKGSDFTLTGEKLHFDNATKTAQVRNNVILRDQEMTLTTNQLDYNLDTEIGHYFGGGHIVSNANKNTLTSDVGYYHSKIETFYFRRKVVLKNPDYVVKSDTMQYNSASEITYFFGPTTIVGDKTTIYCENGYYNTKTDQSRFGKNAKIISDKTILTGDSMFYDGKKEIGEVYRNVTIRDTTQSYIISGDYGRHLEKSKTSFVTGRALMQQMFDSDTLFMHADTLRATPDTLGKDVVYAYNRVKLFKKDLQGKCDSLVYSQSDSTMRLFTDPVLWSGLNQITGDTIVLTTFNGDLQNLFVNNNGFIISDAMADGDSIQEPSGKYNQIKGRNMTGTFVDNDLHSLYVEGNGQLIYFPKDEKKGEQPKPMGLNKGECSNIFITIRDNELIKLRMETETNSKFSPMRLTDMSKLELDNFLWRADERPRKMEDVFEW